MYKIFCLLIILLSPLYSELLEYKISPKQFQSKIFMHIHILDSKELSFEKLHNIEFSEISDLAYKNKILFAVSDRGYLYRLSLSLVNNHIQKLVLLNAMHLKTKKQKLLKKKKRDSEGLSFMGDKLLVSFERKQRINLYSQEGIKIKKITINKILSKNKNYAKANKGLESVAYNMKYGVITAPEIPLKSEKDETFHTLYSRTQQWHFRYDGSITALEFINKNKIMILLRNFNTFTRRHQTTLLSLNLQKCKSDSVCSVAILAQMDSSKGWNIDNFEGLTKVDKNKYLMISDDNGSFFQKTLLVLFELID